MNIREGVIWAYRLILNREASEDELVKEIAGFTDIQALRRRLRTTGEWALMLDRAGEVFQPRLPIDWQEGVLWAFRLLLRREPSAEELQAHLVDNDSVNALRLRLLTTREFEVNSPGSSAMTDFAIVNAFAPFPRGEPVADGFRDIFGSVTRVRYLDRAWHNLSGYVYASVPRDREGGLHGTSEWVGTLRSVLEARGKFTAMELGAGWGPWLIASQNAARTRGIDKIDLTGVEGATEHHGFMVDNFRNNGVPPEAHSLHHAVVGAEDGIAAFPKLHIAEDDYGANAVFADGERDAAAMRGDLEEIRCISLNTLLAGKDRVDLIHIDIQGHEETVLRAGIDALNAKVRRLVIGTHSRAIEGHLFDLLHDNGWVCESEVPCVLRATMDGRRVLFVDGEQVWRNDRLGGAINV
ncbi:MAG: FkbM family methyltransferase [Pseudomonadota bacterium]